MRQAKQLLVRLPWLDPRPRRRHPAAHRRPGQNLQAAAVRPRGWPRTRPQENSKRRPRWSPRSTFSLAVKIRDERKGKERRGEIYQSWQPCVHKHKQTLYFDWKTAG